MCSFRDGHLFEKRKEPLLCALAERCSRTSTVQPLVLLYPPPHRMTQKTKIRHGAQLLSNTLSSGVAALRYSTDDTTVNIRDAQRKYTGTPTQFSSWNPQ